MPVTALLLPILLIAFGPLDLIIGVLNGHYPTEATVISLVSLVVGIVLLRYNLKKYDAATRLVYPKSTDPESEALDATARLNARLGTGLLVLGLCFNLLFVINGFVGTVSNPNDPNADLVQTVFILLFNLMVAGLEIFGALIYTTDRH